MEDQNQQTNFENTGDPQTSWYDNLNPDLRNHPSIQKFESPEGLAKSYVELEKLIGKEKVVLPTDKSSKEEWDAFYNRIGRPEDFNGYEVPELEIDDKLRMPDHSLEAFRTKAHELGLTNKQFSELYGLYHELNQNQYNQMLESSVNEKAKTETELRKEWGQAYEAKVDGAQKVINTFFKDKDVPEAFNLLANNKGFIQAMADIADKLGEGVIQGGSKMTQTPAQAQQELAEIMADTNHPYFNELDPRHKVAVERVLSLQQMIEQV